MPARKQLKAGGPATARKDAVNFGVATPSGISRQMRTPTRTGRESRHASDRHTQRLETGVSHRKQTTEQPSDRHSSNRRSRALSARSCATLPETANRVETHVSRRKQRIASPSTRDTSRPPHPRQFFAFRLAGYNSKLLADRTRLVVFVFAVIGGRQDSGQRARFSSPFSSQRGHKQVSPLNCGTFRTCVQISQAAVWGERKSLTTGVAKDRN